MNEKNYVEYTEDLSVGLMSVVIRTGTRVPVSVSVTRVPIRYPGNRMALNAHLNFLEIVKEQKFIVHVSSAPI